jgi:hypothetical protein
VETRLHDFWRPRRSSNSSFIVHYPLPLSNGWANCPLLLLGCIRVLEVFQPTSPHGQSINLLGDGGTLVLPHVISKTQIDAYLNSQIISIICIISTIHIFAIISIISAIKIIAVSLPLCQKKVAASPKKKLLKLNDFLNIISIIMMRI